MGGVARPAGGSRGWVVGRVAGAPVVVSPGWVAAAVILTFLSVPAVSSWAPGLGAGAYVVAGVFVLLLLASIFLHELAHALVARRRGVVVHELAVTLLGGHTRLGSDAPDPLTSSLVSAAGPAVNLGLAGVAWLASGLLPPGLPSLVVAAAAVANGFVGLFNLVPALPLDGGRILEAAVWHVTGERSRGTLVAGRLGQVTAVVVLVAAFAEPLLRGTAPDLAFMIWGVAISAFLWTGASDAVRASRAEAAVARVSVDGLMTPALAVPLGGTLRDLETVPAGHEVVLVDGTGRPAAWVDRAALGAVPPEVRGTTPTVAVAVPLPSGARVDAGLVGRPAVRAVAAAATTSPVMVVTDSVGRVVGVLRAQAVVDALRPRASAARGAADPGGPPSA